MARDYHVAKTGSDAAAGTFTSPWLTIAYALEHGGGPGNRIYIRAGTYAEEQSTFLHPIVGGSSWPSRLFMSRWASDVVKIAPTSGQRCLTLADADSSFIEFEGIEFDASAGVTIDAIKVTNATVGGVSRNIQFTDCDIHGAPSGGNGILVTAGHHVKLLRCKVHHNGALSTDHGAYLSSHDCLVENCDVYDNAGYGVHIYNSGAVVADRNIVRDSRCHHNGTAGNSGSAGIILSSGSDNVAEDCECFAQPVGIRVDYLAFEAVVERCTLYANTVAQLSVGAGAKGTILDDNRYPVAA